MAKILLVEDNQMNRRAVERRLKRRGFEIISALNGQIAVERAEEEKPDLILMDLSLPVMDGWEATQVIRENSTTCEIPIIALTAHALESDRKRALELGCDDFETKPVDVGRLLDKIGRFLDE